MTRVMSVKERKNFFERLAPSNDEHGSTPFVEKVCVPALIPPQKPKRTFEHNHYLAMQLASTMASSLPPQIACDENVDSLVNMFDCAYHSDSPSSSHCYAVSPVAYRRHRSEEDLYAVPICEDERIRRNGASHHQFSLYYASADLVRNKEETKPHLSRKSAFRKPLKNPEEACRLKSSNHSDLKQRASRAQLVRKSTIETRKRELAFSAEPKLFESALLIKLEDISNEDSKHVVRKPKVEFVYPENVHCEFERTPELFYPNFCSQVKHCGGDCWPGNEEYLIALTLADGSRRYAYCIKYLERRTDDKDVTQYPCVFTIISPIQSSAFYLDLVRNAFAYGHRSTEMLNVFLNSVYNHRYPSVPGSSLIVIEKLAIGVTKRIEIKNYGQILGKTGSAAVIARLSPEVTVCLVAALLGEQRVLIAGNTVGDTDCYPIAIPTSDEKISCSTTRVVQVLEALIRPFCWPHTFVPVVPDNLVGFCDNPTPYLMGILRCNLNKVKELIVEDKNDIDKRQIDFLFVDIDTGLVNPSPPPLESNVEQWRTETALLYCEKLGWPRKMTTSLIRGFRDAIVCSPSAAADLKVENAMLKFYSQLFGHYRFAGAHQNWNDETRRFLIAGQPEKLYRPYLEYLMETTMFVEWITARKNACSMPSQNSEILPSSDEDLNRRIDQFWITEFNKITPKELRRFVSRVGNILHLKK